SDGRRFPCPRPNSRRLWAGCRTGRKQSPPVLVPGKSPQTAPIPFRNGCGNSGERISCTKTSACTTQGSHRSSAYAAAVSPGPATGPPSGAVSADRVELFLWTDLAHVGAVALTCEVGCG